MAAGIHFFQLFEKETSTYTYILGDKDTKDAFIIDPVIETVERDLKLLKECGLKLKYVLETHVHADHITAAGELRKRTGAKIALGKLNGVECADIQLEDGQRLSVGKNVVKALSTPGHTDGCVCFLVGNLLFSGDTLLIRGCGRTDFQAGNSQALYNSVWEKLFSLPDDTVVFPAHDYNGHTSTTIGLEKRFNPRLGEGVGKERFIEIMRELKLARPARIDIAVPANKRCGEA